MFHSHQAPTSCSGSSSNNELSVYEVEKEIQEGYGSGDDEVVQMMYLLSNMIQKMKFGRSNRQHYSSSSFNPINNSNNRFNNSNFQERDKQQFIPSNTPRTATLTPIEDKQADEDNERMNNVICFKCLGRGHFARDCKVKAVKN